MVYLNLSDLPDDVRDHLVVLEHIGDELPDGATPFPLSTDDYGFPDDE